MGCDFQEGFAACFNCLVLKDAEHGLARRMALAGASGRLPGYEPKGWELPSPLLSAQGVTVGGPGQAGCRDV